MSGAKRDCERQGGDPARCVRCGKLYPDAGTTPDEWQCECGGVISDEPPIPYRLTDKAREDPDLPIPYTVVGDPSDLLGDLYGKK